MKTAAANGVTLFSDTSTSLTILIGCITALVVYYHIRVFSFWRVRGIKGPQPWPIFGTMIYYMFKNKNQLEAEWRHKYGHTYGVFEGYHPALRTTDNNLLKHIFIKNFQSFTDRNMKYTHNEVQKRWLLWSRGDLWNNQRPLISPMFSSLKMRAILPKMSSCIDTLLSRVEEKVSKSASQGSPTDSKGTVFSKQDLSCMTLDVIATCFYGLQLDTYNNLQNEFIRRAFEFSRQDPSRFLMFLLLPNFLASWLKFDLVPYERFEYFDKLCQKLIDERRRTFSTGTTRKRDDFVQALLEAKIPDKYEKVFSVEDDRESHYNAEIGHEELDRLNELQSRSAKHFRSFDDVELRGQMTFLLIAGFETTSTTIGFCINELAQWPQVQDELFEEISSKYATVEELSSEMQYSDLLDLKKLDACISEVLRLYGPITDLNRLVTAKEGVVLPTEPPIELPYNTAIATNCFLLHRDSDYFNEPTRFDMTRFYPENRSKLPAASFMPFGLGPRYCAGMRFALLEIKLFLAKLILKYRIQPAAADQKYPPEFKQHAFFLLLEHDKFRLVPR